MRTDAGWAGTTGGGSMGWRWGWWEGVGVRTITVGKDLEDHQAQPSAQHHHGVIQWNPNFSPFQTFAPSLSAQPLRTDLTPSCRYEEFALNPYLNAWSIKEVYVNVSTAAHSAVTSIASSSFVPAQFSSSEAKPIFKESCWRGQSFMQGTHHLCMGTSLGILAACA